MKLLQQEMSGQPSKQWLKTSEVCKLLGLFADTLQTLPNNGTLPFTKIGGVVYYDIEEIMKMMERNKIKKL